MSDLAVVPEKPAVHPKGRSNAEDPDQKDRLHCPRGVDNQGMRQARRGSAVLEARQCRPARRTGDSPQIAACPQMGDSPRVAAGSSSVTGPRFATVFIECGGWERLASRLRGPARQSVLPLRSGETRALRVGRWPSTPASAGGRRNQSRRLLDRTRS